jgi:hypothetical protein
MIKKQAEYYSWKGEDQLPVETWFINVVYQRQDVHPLTFEASKPSFPIDASCGLAEGFPRWELAGHSHGFMTAIIRGTEFRRRIAVSVGADTEKRNGCALSKPVLRYFTSPSCCLHVSLQVLV